MQGRICFYYRLKWVTRQQIGLSKTHYAAASMAHNASVYKVPQRYIEDGLFDTNVDDLSSFMEYMSKPDTLPLINHQPQEMLSTSPSSVSSPPLPSESRRTEHHPAIMSKELKYQLTEMLETNPPSSLADFIYFIQALAPYSSNTHALLSKLIHHLYTFDQSRTVEAHEFLDQGTTRLLAQKCFELFSPTPFDAYHILQFLAEPLLSSPVSLDSDSNASASSSAPSGPAHAISSKLKPIANYRGSPLVWLLAKHNIPLSKECYFMLFQGASKYSQGSSSLYSFLKSIETLYHPSFLPSQAYFLAFYDYLNRRTLTPETEAHKDGPSTLKSNEAIDAVYQDCVTVCQRALETEPSACKSHLLVKSIYHAHLVRSQRIQASILVFKHIIELFGPIIVANPSLMYRFLSRYLLAGHLKEALLVLQSYEAVRPGLVANEPTLCNETLRLLNLIPGKISTTDLYPFLALMNLDHLPATPSRPTGPVFHYWHLLLKYDPSTLKETLDAAHASTRDSLSPLMLTFFVSVYANRFDKTGHRFIGDWIQAKLSLPSPTSPSASQLNKPQCLSNVFEKFHTRLYQLLQYVETHNMRLDGYSLAKIIEWLYAISDWKNLNEIIFVYRKQASCTNRGLEELIEKMRSARATNMICYSLVMRNEWLVVSELTEIAFQNEKKDSSLYHHCLIIKQCLRVRHDIRKYLTSTACYLPDSSSIESLLQYLHHQSHSISHTDSLQLSHLLKDERKIFFVGQLRTILKRPPDWFLSLIQPDVQGMIQAAIQAPHFFSLRKDEAHGQERTSFIH